MMSNKVILSKVISSMVVSLRRPVRGVLVAVALVTGALTANGMSATATVTSSTTSTPAATTTTTTTTPPPAPERVDDVISVDPARIFESRVGPGMATVDGQSQGVGRLPGNYEVVVPVAGRAGVAANAQGVWLTLTVIDPYQPGYLTTYPCGTKPTASNVNYLGGGVVANAAFVALDGSGSICVQSLVDIDLAIDVSGYTVEGHTVAVSPVRLADTRPGRPTVDGGHSGTGRLAANASNRIQIAGRGGIPGNAVGVILNVAAVDTDGAGFLTVFPCSEGLPLASNLNFVSAGAVVANQVVTKIDSQGGVCLNSPVATDVVVDVFGYIEVGSSITPISPSRLVDTRYSDAITATVDGLYAATGSLLEREAIRVQVRGRPGVAADAVAAIVNVTAIGPRNPGFITLYACGSGRPLASSVNYSRGQLVPNSVLVPLDEDGALCVYSLSAVHILVDLNATVGGQPGPLGVIEPMPSSPAPSTGPHKFQRVYEYQGIEVPVRWNPCRPIRYAVNTELADPARVEVMNKAIADISAMMGIEMIKVGEISLNAEEIPDNADVVIMYSDEANFGQLAGDAIGLAAGNTFGYVDVGGRLYGQRTLGVVVVDVEVTDASKVRGTWLHEMGHLFGLGHVADRSQLMYPYETGLNELKDGDRAGLWRLSSAWGCMPEDGPFIAEPNARTQSPKPHSSRRIDDLPQTVD